MGVTSVYPLTMGLGQNGFSKLLRAQGYISVFHNIAICLPFYYPFVKYVSVHLSGHLLNAYYIFTKPGEQDRHPCLVKDTVVIQEITMRCVMKEGIPGIYHSLRKGTC